MLAAARLRRSIAAMHVRTAVIPAAGLGTRFLPATKAVAEGAAADHRHAGAAADHRRGASAPGIDHIVIVTSHAKPAIEAYFEPSRRRGRQAARHRAARDGRPTRVDRPRRAGHASSTRTAPLGLGHAVGCAAEAVGDEPFAVLLPDELMGDSSLLDQMARLCESTGGSVVGLKQVPREQVSAYGVIDPSTRDGRRRCRRRSARWSRSPTSTMRPAT